MGPNMKFQAVVLAGGISKKLYPLASKDVPKALLPVGNRPVLSYVLELLEENNLNDIIVVVAGIDATAKIESWITSTFDDRLHVKVVTTPENCGTADALRLVIHRLVADDILVVSGDLVCDIPLGAVAALHRRREAAVTALLCPQHTSGAIEASGSSKDKAKQPAPSDIIGLGADNQRLLFMAAGSQLQKDLKISRSVLETVGQIQIRTDLVDAHLYTFNRLAIQEVLKLHQEMKSIKHELLPYLVRSHMRFKYEVPKEFSEMVQTIDKKGGECCAYLASKGKYCIRVNSIQAFGDVNRDIAGDLIHLTGYAVSNQNNVIHPTAIIGSKSTVGPYCILGEGSQLGDKCSVKRSVVGRHCRIGSNVKIINSVVMDHVTLEDGCLVQGSVLCSNCHMQERAVLKDCQVGPGYTIGIGSEHRAEALAKKEKP